MKKGMLLTIVLFVALILIGVTTVNAQTPEPPRQIEYVGSETCKDCHTAEHKSWAASMHARMIQDPEQSPTATVILADFAQFTQVITDTRARYTARDVIYTLGLRHSQRYIISDPRTKRLVIGVGQWNIAEQGQAPSGIWQNAPGGADWLNECAGCHTTGLNLEIAKTYRVGDKVLPFVGLGIGCESCHGPGGEHIQSPSTDNIPANKIKALDAAICGQCHTRGSSPEIDGETHSYPIGYTPGQALSTRNFIPVKPTGVISDVNWWQDEHAKNYRMQYLEWLSSGHAQALETLKKVNAADSCLGCHSIDYMIQTSAKNVTTPTLKTAQFGLTCQACHTPHAVGAPTFDPLLRKESYALCTTCHTATSGGTQPLASGIEVHYPTQEMFEGTGALDVTSQPSVHFSQANGPSCTLCHMPATASNTSTGDIATHNWKIVMPGQSGENETDACSTCHSDPLRASLKSQSQLQQIIDARQKEIKNKITTLTKLLKDAKSAHPEWDPKAPNKTELQTAYEKAFTNVSFVETEGSFGIHNYEYASAILAKAEGQLKIAMVTPTPTPKPTQTPTPTATPIQPPSTPTPIPPPSGGASWSIWGVLIAVIAVVVVLLVVRRPDKAS